MVNFPSPAAVGDTFRPGNLTYRFDGKGWLSNPPNSAITDAPADGQQYARKDADWTVVESGFADAPTDGYTYGRQLAEWKPLELSFVRKDGDTMTGPLGLNPLEGADAMFTLQKPAAEQRNIIYGMTGWDQTWSVALGDSLQNFVVNSYDANGAAVTALTINRASNVASFGTAALRLDPPTGDPQIYLNKTAALQSCVVYGQNAGSLRWAVIPGSAEAENGTNTGSNFLIQRYADSGAYIAQSFSIKRTNGAAVFSCNSVTSSTADYNLTLEQTAAGSPCFLWLKTNIAGGGKTIRVGTYFEILNAAQNLAILSMSDAGQLSVTGNILGGQGMGFVWDGANANFLRMGSSSANWSWQWNRSSGNLAWLNGSGAGIFNVGATGAISALQYASSSAAGLAVTGYGDDGAGSNFQDLVQGNPAWGWISLRGWHARGAWAGFKMQSAGNGIDFILSNGGGWGSINALAFNVQSDRRTKEDFEEIADACATLEGIQAWSYAWKGELGAFETTPTRRVGLVAQDVQERIPLAVTGTDNLMIDYAAVTAYAVQAVSELLARVKALEAEVQTLKGATP